MKATTRVENDERPLETVEEKGPSCIRQSFDSLVEVGRRSSI
jgi:hypothetical protein